MQSYHDRHPEVGLAVQGRPWRHPIARRASHWHNTLSGHAAPEQQAFRTSCLCVHGLMTTHLLRTGAMPWLQDVFRHGKASGSSGRRHSVLRHAVCAVLSASAIQPKLFPLHSAACPPAQHTITCELSTRLMLCTWPCRLHAQQADCSRLCSISSTPSPSTALSRRPSAPLPAASWSSCASMASLRRRPASTWSRSLSSELGDALL